MSRHVSIITAAMIAVAAGALVYAAVVSYTESAASDGHESTESIANRLESTAPSPQQPALADETISDAEYVAAVDATVACANAAGAAVQMLPGTGKAPPSFTFTAATTTEGEQIRGILDGCKVVHFNAVQELWNAQHRPSEAQAQDAVRWVAQCVADAGFAVDAGSATGEQMVSWTMGSDVGLAAATGTCVNRHYETFGFWP